MVGSLLLDEQPLIVLPGLATLVGLNEAIILQQVHYWLYQNEKAGRNFNEGYHWTFNSYPQWQTQIPFLSLRTIRRTFVNLEKSGLLIAATFNKSKYDRSKWYRIDYPRLEGAHRSGQIGHPPDTSGPIEEAEVAPPIPETTPETINKETPKVVYGEIENVRLTDVERQKFLKSVGET